MTTFGWKRKSSARVQSSPAAFKPQEQEEEAGPEVDWLAVNKKLKLGVLEDGKARFERLKKEGICLAEEGSFWQAISRWEEALVLEPRDARIWEMKAQALVSLHEWPQAVEAAARAVEEKRTWWVAQQTLGRAHLGLGHLELARIAFQKAVHLNPEEQELRKEDLVGCGWCVDRLDIFAISGLGGRAAEAPGGGGQAGGAGEAGAGAGTGHRVGAE